MVLTIIHHLYGATIYDAPFRLHVVYFAIPVIVLLLLAYGIYRRYAGTLPGNISLAAFLLTAVIVPVILIGVYEGGYNHLVKNIAYFSGAPPETMARLYPSDLYEMPDDFWFEFSGILQFVAGIYAIVILVRMIRPWLTQFLADR